MNKAPSELFTAFDRRLTKRVKRSISLRIQLYSNDGEKLPVEAELNNISQGGLCFQTSQRLLLTKKYEIGLYRDNELNTVCLIQLLWIQEQPTTFIYGASFINVDLSFLQRLFESDNNDLSIEDRRRKNRRTFTSSGLLSLEHRKTERRAAIRLRERQAKISRFVIPELKQLIYRRVVISGLGIVSPVGNDKESFMKSLRNGNSGVQPITRFNAEHFPCRLGGEVRNFNPNELIKSRKARLMDRATQLIVSSAIMARRDANLTGREDRRRIGVSVGTTIGGLGWAFAQDDIYEEEGFDRMHPYTIAAASPNACSGEIAAELKANGPCVTFSQGCTSSANAIAYAYTQVKDGYADVIFAGGCEAPFLPSLYGAFCRSGIMAKTESLDDAVPRPFSKNRSGIILAEGAAILVIEELDHALARGAKIYAEIVSSASTCDGYHMVQPVLNGMEASRAMSLCLEEGKVLPDQITVIFTHATGSKDMDSMEMKALSRVFQSSLKNIPVANTKSLTGYSQGAAAAIECVAASLSLKHNFVPPVLNTVETEISLNVRSESRDMQLDTALINCFGFGGKNVCLILKRFSDENSNNSNASLKRAE